MHPLEKLIQRGLEHDMLSTPRAAMHTAMPLDCLQTVCPDVPGRVLVKQAWAQEMPHHRETHFQACSTHKSQSGLRMTWSHIARTYMILLFTLLLKALIQVTPSFGEFSHDCCCSYKFLQDSPYEQMQVKTILTANVYCY